MGRQPADHPTEFELAVLKVLWRDSPQTVREIREALAKSGRENAHTSVITILNIMVDKGYLNKKKEGKVYRFWPIVQEEDVSQKMLGDMVSRVFDGSAKQLVLRLIDREDVDDEELRELRKLINRKMRERR